MHCTIPQIQSAESCGGRHSMMFSMPSIFGGNSSHPRSEPGGMKADDSIEPMADQILRRTTLVLVVARRKKSAGASSINQAMHKSCSRATERKRGDSCGAATRLSVGVYSAGNHA